MVVDGMKQRSWKQRLPSRSDHLPCCDLVPLMAFTKVRCMTLWFETRDLMIPGYDRSLLALVLCGLGWI